MQNKKINLNGQEYLIGRLDLFASLEVSRLVAPILPYVFHETMGALAKAVAESKDASEATPQDKLNEAAKLLFCSKPVLDALARMKREDFETVIRTCLSCIERNMGKTWSRLMQNDQLMFQDIDTGTAIILAGHVIWRELRPTIDALLK